MSEYRKFIPPKTLAGLATLAGGGRILALHADTNEAARGHLKNQSAPAKPAKVAKVCAQCSAGGDLWHLDTPAGPVLVHRECARFLPKAEPAEPSASYQATSAGPDGTACKVEIVELPVAVRYRKVFAFLQLKPLAYVSEDRWRMAVSDGRVFLSKWGETAQRLGWTSADLFGLHAVPEPPHPSWRRLSRYDATGLIWLLEGREVIALTEATATIRNPNTGNVTVFRKNNAP